MVLSLWWQTWLASSEHLLREESTIFADRLERQCEKERGVKNDSKEFGPEQMERLSCC